MAGDFVVGEDDEGDDTVGGRVAVDRVPGTTVLFGIPRGEEVGVVEGFFDGEEDFFVSWVAELCNRNGDGDEENEKEEEA